MLSAALSAMPMSRSVLPAISTCHIVRQEALQYCDIKECPTIKNLFRVTVRLRAPRCREHTGAGRKGGFDTLTVGSIFCIDMLIGFDRLRAGARQMD